VVLSATPGIAGAAERDARRQRDEELAARIEMIGVDAFLDEWLAQPMFRSLPKDALERAARSSDVSGLAHSLRHAGTGTQRDLTDPLRALSVATSILAGTKDAKFVAKRRDYRARYLCPSQHWWRTPDTLLIWNDRTGSPNC